MNQKTTIYLLGMLMLTSFGAFGQNAFHTLTMPQGSPKVTESQQLGVTDIEISYSSPALRGRDVWNNSRIIPQGGEPIAWRAGANMNTTISFSTDVMINGQSLTAGKYGFHIIPNGDEDFSLLFAHANDMWGSYYLDVDKDVSLRLEVKSTECPLSEQLDYRFVDRAADEVTIGLDWGTKRIPFTVSVDLNGTTVASLRNELRGINTYHWQAWNDAALWCLDHDTNLEEALQWAQRSIDGGYGGFAADKNLTNLSTKMRIQMKLNMDEDAQATINEMLEAKGQAYDYNNVTQLLLGMDDYDMALKLCNKAIEMYPDVWYLVLNQGVCNYLVGNKAKAEKLVGQSLEMSPENYKGMIERVIGEIKAGTYKLPG